MKFNKSILIFLCCVLLSSCKTAENIYFSLVHFVETEVSYNRVEENIEILEEKQLEEISLETSVIHGGMKFKYKFPSTFYSYEADPFDISLNIKNKDNNIDYIKITDLKIILDGNTERNLLEKLKYADDLFTTNFRIHLQENFNSYRDSTDLEDEQFYNTHCFYYNGKDNDYINEFEFCFYEKLKKAQNVEVIYGIEIHTTDNQVLHLKHNSKFERYEETVSSDDE